MPRQGVPYPGSEICSIKCKLKEIWNALQGKLHSINGVLGDGQGNVKIVAGNGIVVNNDAAQNQIEIVNTGAAPEGMIETINDIGPDENSNFSISAGTGIQINEGENGIEIENISEGAVYTGVSPIIINENNEISLEGWTKVTSTDWSFLAENGSTKYDILIGFNYQEASLTYIPKGTSTTLRLTRVLGSYFSNTVRMGSLYYLLSNVLRTGNIVYDTQGYVSFEIEAQGSDINEILIYRYHNAQEYIGSGLNKTEVQLYYR